ncbi:MAG: SPOR domain-containing protein [Candidatus Omnitrophica bacterium]|nr:SPOR domain-containing protein [Candidatus Omnitrophota bacterium]
MDENQQLELFSQGADDSARGAATKHSSSLIARIRKGERIIIMIIVIAVSSIISFSLGVEKGKRVAMVTKNTVSFDLAALPKPKAQALITPQAPTAILPAPQVSTVIQGYTIQLASYKTMEGAQKEAQTLRKKGLTTIILSKGSYKVLCVGRFNNKETAQPLLSELSSRYEGCYLRRL